MISLSAFSPNVTSKKKATTKPTLFWKIPSPSELNIYTPFPASTLENIKRPNLLSWAKQFKVSKKAFRKSILIILSTMNTAFSSLAKFTKKCSNAIKPLNVTLRPLKKILKKGFLQPLPLVAKSSRQRLAEMAPDSSVWTGAFCRNLQKTSWISRALGEWTGGQKIKKNGETTHHSFA